MCLCGWWGVGFVLVVVGLGGCLVGGLGFVVGLVLVGLGGGGLVAGWLVAWCRLVVCLAWCMVHDGKTCGFDCY